MPLTEWPRNIDVLYCHLPKCAGTTVVAHLRALRQPYSIQWGNISESFNNYLGTPSDGKFVSGHFRHLQMKALEDSGRQYRLFTFLRDPIDRLVSAYRYTISETSPNFLDYRERFPTFEAYAEWYPANDVCDWLVGGAATVDEYLVKLEARFDFIGLQERFDADMFDLIRLMGSEYRPMKPQNVTNGPSVETWPDLRAWLSEKHNLDIEVHKELIKRHDAIYRTSPAE